MSSIQLRAFAAPGPALSTPLAGESQFPSHLQSRRPLTAQRSRTRADELLINVSQLIFSDNRTRRCRSCCQLALIAQRSRQSLQFWIVFWLVAEASQMFKCHDGGIWWPPNNKQQTKPAAKQAVKPRRFVGSIPAAFMYRPRRYLSTDIALGAARCCAFGVRTAES